MHVDNGSDDSLAVLVDGAKVVELAPHDIAPVDVTFGTHTFEVQKDGASVDRVEQKVEMGRSYIFNPKGLNRYEKFEAVYQTWKESLREGGVSSSPKGRIEGQNWIADTVDFDLLTEMPWSVPAGWKTPITKVKIYKLMPEKIGAEEAVLVLSKNRHAYNGTHDPENFRAAIHALRDAGMNPARIEVLFTCFDGKPMMGLEGDAASALSGLIGAEQLPQLKEMIQDQSQKKEDGVSKALPSLMSLFVRSYELSEVVTLYGQVNDRARYHLLEACVGVPYEKRGEYGAALGPLVMGSSDVYLAPKGLDLLRHRERVKDIQLISKVDDAIHGVKEAKMREYRQNEWDKYLAEVLNGVKEAELLDRLEKILSSPEFEAQSRAAYSLQKSGRRDAVIKAYPAMSARLRGDVMARVRGGVHEPEDVQVIALGLKDPEPRVRAEAFRAGCEADFFGREDVIALLNEALAAEKDAKAAGEMKRMLDHASSRRR